MLYLCAPGGQLRVFVLETPEVDRLKLGVPILTPDRAILVAWTPDQPWLDRKSVV